MHSCNSDISTLSDIFCAVTMYNTVLLLPSLNATSHTNVLTCTELLLLLIIDDSYSVHILILDEVTIHPSINRCFKSLPGSSEVIGRATIRLDDEIGRLVKAVDTNAEM